MEYNKSYHIFHTWGDMRNKNNLDRFAKKIINSKDLDLYKVIKWSREYKLTHNNTSRRVVDEIQSAKKGWRSTI